MAKLVECKTCKKEVANGVRKCPHCGQTNPTISTKQNIFAFIFLVVIAVILLKACESTPEEAAADKAAAAERECKDSNMAYAMSQQFIKRSLKSPATADFPFQPNQNIYKGECLHLISSYVDSQNSFGATIRSQTSVSLRFDKELNNWLLEDIKIK